MSSKPSSLSAAKLALAVRQARQSGDASLLGAEPIAIVGLACRLPGNASTPERFWKNLCDGVDSVSDPPAGRWPEIPAGVPCRAGYLGPVDEFDASFFGIPPPEAEHLDPQQRLLLEVTWESIWDAGIEPEALAGSRTGVFTAVYNGYYERMLLNQPRELNAYSASGTTPSTASGRVAFLLDLRGPAVSINTACSSSLVTVHLACQSLRTGDSDMVLAGGVNLKLSSTEMVSSAQMGLLAPDGRAKTFDWRANGFVPGEGCVVTVLKRLSDALANGDRIRAVIRGTAINQDGRTSTMTAPNGTAQREVIRAALVNARVDPGLISFVEAHGTGTALGDPIEVEALTEALGPHEAGALPCMLGSVKTNIGHLEAAAGFASLAKVVLALENEAIPGNLHFERLNPHITLDGTRFVLPQSLMPWPRGDQPRWAGLSAFGFSGTNAHLVLEEAPRVTPRRRSIEPRTWKRERFWFIPRATRAEAAPELKQIRVAGSADQVWEIVLSSAGWLAGHEIDGRVIVPLTVMADLLLRAAPECALADFEVEEPIVLPEHGELTLQVIRRAAGGVELYGYVEGTWRRYAQAGTATASPAELRSPEPLASLQARIVQTRDVDHHYLQVAEQGIRFGEAFRTVRGLWSGKGEALGLIESGVSPLLLDGCLQVVSGLIPDAGRYVPVSVKRVVAGSLDGVKRAWAHLRLRDSGLRGSVEFDVTVFDSSGTVVALLESVILRPRDSGAADWFYELGWRLRSLPSGESTARRWLVVTNGGNGASLSTALLLRGAASVEVCERVSEQDTEVFDEVVLFGADLPAALATIQTLATRGKTRLWVVTEFAQRVRGESSLNVMQAGLWGLLRTARREKPELRSVVIDVDALSLEQLADELTFGGGEDQLAYRGGERFVPRLARKPPASAAPWQLRAGQIGLLETLAKLPVERRAPARGEVEIETEAFGLNFRDVLMVLGLYPGKDTAIGCEVAGRVVRTGEAVEGLKPGDDVVAVGSALFGSHIVLDARQVCRRPAAVRVQDAVSVPVAHVTARYALDWVGGLKPGERVLVHAGAGGVGTAAILQAVRAGAEVFATAGTEEKRAYVRALGAKEAFSSRELGFAQAILERTNGRGVDLILNSLSGEFHGENLRTLAEDGRYIEIGKAGILSEAEVRRLRPGATYHVVDWAGLLATDPLRIRAVLDELMAGLADGTVAPLRVQEFPVDDAARAFRFMANGRHTGKIVLNVRRVFEIHKRGAYLITGGLGALGLRSAEWLARRGAGRIVLTGRTLPNHDAEAHIERLRQRGVQVDVWTGDVAEAPVVAGWMERLDREGDVLRGVIHAAGVLADGVISNLTTELFDTVFRPKVMGARNLHECTVARNLDFFLLYSSVASLVGAPGQANYAAANECLNTLAHQRVLQGLPALSIAWGPWEGAGMAAQLSEGHWQRGLPGVRGFSAVQGMQSLDHLAGESGVIAAIRCHWPAARALARNTRLFDELTGGLPEPAAFPQQSGLQSADDLLRYLEGQARRVIGLPETQHIEPDQPLFDAGLDSLAAVEFRNILAAEFQRTLSSTLLFDYPTLNALHTFFAPKQPESPKPNVVSSLQTEVEELSEAEAEELLAAELKLGSVV